MLRAVFFSGNGNTMAAWRFFGGDGV